MTESRLRDRLRRLVQKHGHTEIARRIGVEPPYLHAVLKGAPIGPSIAKHFGYERDPERRFRKTPPLVQ